MNALYLPITSPPPAVAGQLLLFFDKLLYYRPAENSPAPLSLAGFEDLLHGYPPVPFGTELDRFSRLLEDMQTHAAEYYQAYLRTVGRGEEEALEAGWRRMARELRQLQPQHDSGQDELWRARLYLALAEIYHARELEISSGLATVADKEAAMLKELQGEEDDDRDGLPFRDLQSTIMAPAPGNSSRLLTAWGVLYLADTNTDRPWLLTTVDPEGAMLLREKYESAAGRPPEKILSLPLPPIAPAPDYPVRREAWRTAAMEPLSRLNAILEETAFTGAVPYAADQTRMEVILRQWNDALAADPPVERPAAADALPALTFYRLPGISFPRLFRLICRQEEEGRQAAPSSPHAVLGVVEGERMRG